MEVTDIRTVSININPLEVAKICGKVGEDNFNRAIGYLATWNYTYPSVTIYADDETDLVAVYRSKDDEIGYVIGAVWHDDHYGFHS